MIPILISYHQYKYYHNHCCANGYSINDSIDDDGSDDDDNYDESIDQKKNINSQSNLLITSKYKQVNIIMIMIDQPNHYHYP